MKKLLFVLLCATIMPILKAQDVIVTRDAQRIDAVIQEVSETEIKYKKVSNPDGPTFVISVSQIASVLYRNGDVQTFSQSDASSQPSTELSETGVKVASDALDITFVPGQQIKKVNSNLYYYGNIEMNKYVFRDFLKNTCPDAYKQYKTGYNMKIAGYSIGISFLCVGFGLLGASLGIMKSSTYSTSAKKIKQSTDDAMPYVISGSVISIVGGIMWLSLDLSGAKKQATAYDLFNTRCANNNQPKLSLNFGVTNNGLGVMLRF